MPLQGNLNEMSLANLIQVNCQEMRSARLILTHHEERGEVYFSDGQVVHAVAGADVGAEAIYRLLLWDSGTFSLETDVPSPDKSIHMAWSELLLEGMKRVGDKPSTPPPAATRAPSMIERLRAIEGVNGVVAAACDGVVLAASVPESDGERESAVAVFVGLAAHQIGDTLQLGTLNQCIVTLKNRRVLVLEQPDRYLGLWLDDNASPAIVSAAAARALKE